MFRKTLKGIRVAELAITGFLFCAALAVLTVNVFLRRIPQIPALNWAEEFQRYCSIWITFIGMSLCAEDDLHVGVDIVYQMSPTPARKVLKIICMLAACVFCAIFTYSSVKYVMMALNYGTKSPVMQVPMWIIYPSLPIGSALSTLQYALKFVYYVRIKHTDLAEKPAEDASDINLLNLN